MLRKNILRTTDNRSDFEKNKNRLWLDFKSSTKVGFDFFKIQNFYLEC
jgi:hypothetical protein